jgi:hypothetical protein
MATRSYINLVTNEEVQREDTNQNASAPILSDEGLLVHRSAQVAKVLNGTCTAFHIETTAKFRTANTSHTCSTALRCSLIVGPTIRKTAFGILISRSSRRKRQIAYKASAAPAAAQTSCRVFTADSITTKASAAAEAINPAGGAAKGSGSEGARYGCINIHAIASLVAVLISRAIIGNMLRHVVVTSMKNSDKAPADPIATSLMASASTLHCAALCPVCTSNILSEKVGSGPNTCSGCKLQK